MVQTFFLYIITVRKLRERAHFALGRAVVYIFKSPSVLVWPGGIRPPCMVTDRWISHQISSQSTSEKGDHGGTMVTD